MNRPCKEEHQELQQLQKILTKLYLLLRTFSLVSFLPLKKEPIAISSQFSNKTMSLCKVYNYFDKSFDKIKKCVYVCISIMHHFAFHSFKSVSHTFVFLSKGQSISEVVWCLHSTSTRIYELREEVTTLQDEVEKLTNLVSSLVVTQGQQICPQQPRQQAFQQFIAQNQAQGAPQFDSILVKYAELLPTLLKENLIQTRQPLPVPKRLPMGYKADLSCAFHQGEPGHDIEQCFAFRTVVQKLIQANTLSPNISHNSNSVLSNSILNNRIRNSSLDNRHRGHNLPQFPWNMRICFHSCSKRIWSRPRRLLRYQQDCQHGIDLTFSVTFVKGHLTMILNIVMQWRMQSRIWSGPTAWLSKTWLQMCKPIHYWIMVSNVAAHGVVSRNWVAFNVPSTTPLFK